MLARETMSVEVQPVVLSVLRIFLEQLDDFSKALMASPMSPPNIDGVYISSWLQSPYHGRLRVEFYRILDQAAPFGPSTMPHHGAVCKLQPDSPLSSAFASAFNFSSSISLQVSFGGLIIFVKAVFIAGTQRVAH